MHCAYRKFSRDDRAHKKSAASSKYADRSGRLYEAGGNNTLDTSFCLAALEVALAHGQPAIFNTDQGVQFTSAAYTSRLEQAGIQISWDVRGRALDNVFVERLWRSVKWEEVYLKDYQTVAEAVRGLERYFRFYNHERPHQALGYQTPAQVYGVAA